jgi:hypothetical protein
VLLLFFRSTVFIYFLFRVFTLRLPSSATFIHGTFAKLTASRRGWFQKVRFHHGLKPQSTCLVGYT